MPLAITEKIDRLFRRNSEEVIEISRKSKLKGFSDLLNFAFMPSDKLIMNKDGALSAFFVYKGKDVQSSTDNELDYIRNMFNHVFRLTDENWMIEFNLIRIGSTDYPENTIFPESVSELIDIERKNQYNAEGVHYDTLYYLTVTRGPAADLSRTVKKFVFDTDEEIKDETLDQYIDKFETTLANISDTLSGSMDIMRISGHEIAKFLHYCISGVDENIHMPQIPIFLDSYFANNDFLGGIEPKIGDKYIKVLDFQDFPTATFPTILDILNILPCEYRWSTRFIPLDIDTAKSYMNLHLKHWNQKAKGFMGLIREALNIENSKFDRDALEMADQTEDAMAANQSGLVRFGFLTKVIVLMNEDKEKLEDTARFIRRQLQQLGYLIRFETVNTVEAYLGSIPGHGYYNLRRPLIDSITLANTAPISSIYQGEEFCPCPLYDAESPALFYCGTDGATPFRFNLHVGDIGHTMIIGPTGTGKTTLMGLIMAQHRKYPGSRIYLLDKDNSSKRLIQSLSGDYYDIGSSKGNIHFAPLQYIDDTEEFEWACTFIEELCELQKITITPEVKELIRDSLNTLRSSDRKFWSLHNYIGTVQSNELRSALTTYAVDGIVGNILNSAHDSMEVGSLTGFELGWLLDQKKEVYLPVINYLFRKLYRKFKEQKPALLVLEEAWLYIDNEIISRKIKDWLKTLRKFNAAVIFTSQALADVTNSSISSVLAESCITKIYLSNPNALSSSRKVYELFGLNERQMDLIRNMVYKKEYYITSPRGNRVIDLRLGELALAFLSISNEKEKAEFDRLKSSGDKNYIEKYLRFKNLDTWAEKYREIDERRKEVEK